MRWTGRVGRGTKGTGRKGGQEEWVGGYSNLLQQIHLMRNFSCCPVSLRIGGATPHALHGSIGTTFDLPVGGGALIKGV